MCVFVLHSHNKLIESTAIDFRCSTSVVGGEGSNAMLMCDKGGSACAVYVREFMGPREWKLMTQSLKECILLSVYCTTQEAGEGM